MDAIQAIEMLRNKIDEAKRTGLSSVTVESLEGVLKGIETLAKLSVKDLEKEMEHYRATNAANLVEYEVKSSFDREIFKSVIAAGQNAMKSAMLVNGGAGVALLAFIGHLWERSLLTSVGMPLKYSLLYFVAGVLFAAIATGTTYLTLEAQSRGWKKTSDIINGASILLVAVSFLAFGMGGYQAYTGLTEHLG